MGRVTMFIAIPTYLVTVTLNLVSANLEERTTTALPTLRVPATNLEEFFHVMRFNGIESVQIVLEEEGA